MLKGEKRECPVSRHASCTCAARVLSTPVYSNVFSVGYTPSNTLSSVERFSYDDAGNLTARSHSAPPPAAAGGGAAFTSNADDEAVLLFRHAVATLIGTAEPDAAVDLPLAPGVAVERDAHGNWIATLVPLFSGPAGRVRVQLRAGKAGQPPDYRLADFTVNPSSGGLPRDGDGSLLALPAASGIRYDAGGLPASAPGEEYFYDSFGRRIAKHENGALTGYVWDGMEIAATARPPGSIDEYYSRGPGIAGDVGSFLAETRYGYGRWNSVILHHNHRGDVALATDGDGEVVGEFGYTAFGEPVPDGVERGPFDPPPYAPRFGFSSKERDASGLVYFGFRYYSPGLCRWISEDPIGEEGGLNLYRFCGNDPVNFVDPWGEEVYYSALGGAHAELVYSDPCSTTGFSKFGFEGQAAHWPQKGRPLGENIRGVVNAFWSEGVSQKGETPEIRKSGR
jgi:RHS repeat-associated protein